MKYSVHISRIIISIKGKLLPRIYRVSNTDTLQFDSVVFNQVCQLGFLNSL